MDMNRNITHTSPDLEALAAKVKDSYMSGRPCPVRLRNLCTWALHDARMDTIRTGELVIAVQDRLHQN